MNTVTVHTPLKARAPLAAQTASGLFARLQGWFGFGGAPAGQQQRSDRAAEAAAVREYAQRFARHDPGFASDLIAAADRHERGE